MIKNYKIHFTVLGFVLVGIIPLSLVTTGLVEVYNLYTIVVIGFTCWCQLYFILRTVRRYSSKGVSLWPILPSLYINVAILLYFFLPLVVHIINPKLTYTPVEIDDIFRPVLYFCATILAVNLSLAFFEKKLIKNTRYEILLKSKIKSISSIFPALSAIYSATWVIRMISIATGPTYSTYLAKLSGAEITAKYPAISYSEQILVGDILFVIIVGFWIIYFKSDNKNRKLRKYIPLLIIADVIYFIPSGSKQMVMLPILAYIIAYIILTTNVPTKTIIVSSLILILLLPAHNIYRTYGEVPSVEQISSLNSRRSSYWFLVAKDFISRADASSKYLLYTQSEFQFFGGKSYLQIPNAFIPGQLIGYEGLVDYSSSFGDLNRPGITGGKGLWGEAYANGGYLYMITVLLSVSTACVFVLYLALYTKSVTVFIAYFHIPRYFFLTPHGGISMLVTPLVTIPIFVGGVVLLLRSISSGK